MSNRIIDSYLDAKEAVIQAGFSPEIDWQDQVKFSQVTESDFLRESAWVVLSSGMRESVIRSKFPSVTEAFYSWASAQRIVSNADRCRQRALSVFGHRAKIEAIVTIARRIDGDGFKSVCSRIREEGTDYIRSLPFMGPATSFHLAKNLGLDVVKPDRHLVRVAAAAGFECPKRLCEEISRLVGDRVSVVDLVIWRFATLNPRYETLFSSTTSAVRSQSLGRRSQPSHAFSGRLRSRRWRE